MGAAFLNVRNLLAVWAGKGILSISRRLGHGGSSLPGRVALRIQPAILNRLACGLRVGSIIITGTNGKTTTARLLGTILEDAGYSLVHNRSGANLVEGLTSAFLEASRGGPVKADIALMEVDEATVPEAVADTTVSLVGRGLDLMGGKGFAVLNADDPLVAFLGRGRTVEVSYYGLGDDSWGTRTMHQTREQPSCLLCGRELDYSVFYYGHLGRYHCPGCDFARPEPSVKAADVRCEGVRGSSFAALTGAGERVPVRMPLPGLYNIYNALAAVGAALRLGVGADRAAAAIERAPASFGRMEHIDIEGRDVLLALVKNPIGFNQVLRTILEDRSRPDAAPLQLLIAINDRYADGTDISWLWDVDFEMLEREGTGLGGIVVSGLRGPEMALRLKYAGVPESVVRPVPDLGDALDAALEATAPGRTLHVTPTYTAMLELRDIISRRGYTSQFWESSAR